MIDRKIAAAYSLASGLVLTLLGLSAVVGSWPEQMILLGGAMLLAFLLALLLVGTAVWHGVALLYRLTRRRPQPVPAHRAETARRPSADATQLLRPLSAQDTQLLAHLERQVRDLPTARDLSQYYLLPEEHR